MSGFYHVRMGNALAGTLLPLDRKLGGVVDMVLGASRTEKDSAITAAQRQLARIGTGILSVGKR